MKKNILILFSFIMLLLFISPVSAALRKSVELDGYFDAKFKVEWYDFENASGTRPDSFELALVGETNRNQTKAIVSKDNCDTETNPNVWDCEVRFYALMISSSKIETEYGFYAVSDGLPDNYFARNDYSNYGYVERGYEVLYNEGAIIIIANVKRFYDFNVAFDDADNRDGIRPWILQYTLKNQDNSFVKSIEIKPTNTDSYISTPDGYEYKTSNWKYSANLYPYLIKDDKPDFSTKAEYSITPNISVEGYEYSLDIDDNIYTLNYKYNAKKLDYDIDVKVEFEDNIYKKPDDLALSLYTENDSNVNTVRVSDKNNWQYKFSDLYLNDLNLDPDNNSNVKEAIYKVKVKENEDYDYEITGNQVDGYKVLVKYTGDKIYKFIKGVNQTYIIGKDDNALFQIDAPYSLFENGGKVYIDGKLVDKNNYTSESGSTIIKLSKDYMRSLSVGKHTLKAEFNNGGYADTTFKIEKDNNKINVSSNPNTYDGIKKYILILGISLIGIILSCIIINKRRRYEK